MEFVAPARMMNVHRRIVESVEFARMMYASTAVNFVPFVQNVKMKSVYLQLNAVMKTLVVPAKIARMEFVWIETVELAVPVML